MSDVVRVGEHEIAWSLSNLELDIVISSINVLLIEICDDDLHPMTGANREEWQELLEYFELVKWRAYGAEVFDNSLSSYLK